MSSRRKIEKYCKDHGIYIDSLEYERNGQYIYGDYSDESQWVIVCRYFGGDNTWHTEEFYAYTADEIIENIKDQIKSSYENNGWVLDCSNCPNEPCEACKDGRGEVINV